MHLLTAQNPDGVNSDPGFYILLFLLGVVALLAFTTPNFAYKGKVIYAAVTYTLLLLFYAANNLPYSALSGVITGDMAERNSISSIRFVAVMFAQFFVQVFMLPIIEFAGNGDKAIGIEKVMTWLAIFGTIMLTDYFFYNQGKNNSYRTTKINFKRRFI